MDKSTREKNNKINNIEDKNSNIYNANNKDKEDNIETYQTRRNIKNGEQSESIKLKDYLSGDENSKSNNSKTQTAYSKIQNIQNVEEKGKVTENDDDKKILYFFENLKKKIILTQNVRKYANSIPIGAFCNGISFIIFGIFKTRLLVDEFTNVWSLFVLFGGLGQMTAGIMELIKGREFTSFLYIFYGIYCFTHYILRIVTDRFGNFDLCIFFTAWFLLSIPIIIYSIRSNLIYLLQTVFMSLYFFFRCIGEGTNEDILIEQVSGSCLILSGMCSLYIFFSQTINQYIINCYINTFPFDKNNKIDFPRPIENNKFHKN